jgi:hypothetical protein
MSECHCSDPIDVPPPASRQPIYPYTVSPCPSAPSTFTILPMNALVFPFRLCPDRSVQMSVAQTALVQDRSLRCWVSHEPIGTSVTLQSYAASFWEADRTGRHVVTIYDLDDTAPKGATSLIPAPPGVYYLNVHNLINSSNQFGLRLTQCGCAGTP